MREPVEYGMPADQSSTASGFELWDKETRNALGDFDTETEALLALGKAIATYGHHYVDSIVLVRVGAQGELTRIADGQDLVDRACAAMGRE
jgi:hypothetical protein